MTNGTFGPPLAGEYFKRVWVNKTVRALYDRSKAMPPAAPGSLATDVYTGIVAYILELNGFEAGTAKLPADGDALDKMTIK